MYIGDLGNDGTRYELEEAFSEYGSVKNIWVAKKPPGKQNKNNCVGHPMVHSAMVYLFLGFAFVLMDDPRDAEDAVRALDGSRICGRRVKVGIKLVFHHFIPRTTRFW